MRRLAWLLIAVHCTSSAVAASAAEYRQVPVRVEPPQPVTAIALQSNGSTVPVAVSGGLAKVPADLALPWTVVQLRFEPFTYTKADLEAQRPLLLREVGRFTGQVNEGKQAINHAFSVLLRLHGSGEVQERKLPQSAESEGRFDLSLPAGTYQAVIASDRCGTRLRSGIVIKPGVATDLGVVTCEPTFAVSFRVTDAKSGAPLEGAKIVWDPSDALNAEDARVMYSRLWSGMTDRRGAVSIRVGPIPIPVRWRVEAEGYATERTRRFEMYESRSASLDDVRLKRAATLRVRLHLPDDARDLAGGFLFLGEHPDERSLKYVPVARKPIREGEITFPVSSFGDKRLWLESAAGVKLSYRDIRVEPEMTSFDFSPQPVVIHGRVTRRESGSIEGAAVILADPHDARLILARTRSNASGTYSVKTYQTGDLSLYATPPPKRGTSAGPTFKKLRTTVDQNDYELDFEFDVAGLEIAVTDAETGTPIVADVKARFTVGNGSEQVVDYSTTDDEGKVAFSGYPVGSVVLDVSAKGHRAKQVEFLLKDKTTKTHVIALEASRPISGRVLSAQGSAIAGAIVTAGFEDELEMQGRFQAATDASGRFQFDSTPEPGTPFYIVASGFSLAIAMLDAGAENVVMLSPPSANVVYLIENNAAPKTVHRVVAAPAGGELIPAGVLSDLAEANGMNTFQLLGSGKDGAVVLPQFLGAGTYEFFVTRRPPKGQTRFTYDRVGQLSLPGAKGPALRIGDK